MTPLQMTPLLMTPLLKNYTEFCKKNNIVIKAHQVYGVLWCIRREISDTGLKRRGGVLADEMGMGKTIQMIGVFLLNPMQKTLLIVPPILINQWFSEIRKFTGHVSTVYYGKDRKKINIEDPKSMIVITSYETIRREIDLMKSVAWNRIVCDEAHHLRNPKTQIYENVLKLITSTGPSPIVWCITGTPMHHSPKDLYALYALFGYNDLGELSHEVLRTRFLQRHHSLDSLPKKYENTIMVEWTESNEREMAKDIHRSIPFLKDTNDDSAPDSFWSKKKQPIIVSMIRAKQTCILSKMTAASFMKKEGEEEEEENDRIFQLKTQKVFDQSITTKLQSILSMLKHRRENRNGKVVFCHYRQEMTYLLENLSLDLDHNPNNQWVGTWKDYKNQENQKHRLGDSPILILQIQSGCEGLNLQDRFSEVYFVSPDWNPTLEEQAIARCYRIGQKKPVHVFRFAMNFVDSPESNSLRKQEIQRYHSIYDSLPLELQNTVMSFLSPSSIVRSSIVRSSIVRSSNYSMDQYIFQHTDIKKKRISDFLESFQK